MTPHPIACTCGLEISLQQLELVEVAARGDPAEATERLEHLERHVVTPALRVLLAEAWYGVGNVDRALESLRHAESEITASPTLEGAIALSDLVRQAYAKHGSKADELRVARTVLEIGVKTAPSDLELLAHNLARLLDALDGSPDTPDAAGWRRLGALVASVRDGREPDAADELLCWLEAEPDTDLIPILSAFATGRLSAALDRPLRRRWLTVLDRVYPLMRDAPVAVIANNRLALIGLMASDRDFESASRVLARLETEHVSLDFAREGLQAIEVTAVARSRSGDFEAASVGLTRYIELAKRTEVPSAKIAVVFHHLGNAHMRRAATAAAVDAWLQAAALFRSLAQGPGGTPLDLLQAAINLGAAGKTALRGDDRATEWLGESATLCEQALARGLEPSMHTMAVEQRDESRALITRYARECE